MHTRFITEGKPGVTSRRGANYSTWWNGGLRTTAYFHNQVGILTETIGSPTPGQSIPFAPNRHIADSNNFFAIAPQPWKFRNSIDYSITANRAILDLASRYRETLLYRIYRMGADSIKWGSEDHWTFTPHKLERIQASMPGAGGGAAAAGAAVAAAAVAVVVVAAVAAATRRRGPPTGVRNIAIRAASFCRPGTKSSARPSGS